MKNNSKYIFSFWEPKENIPSYLKLCIKSWQKFLPEYKIIILDYSNLDEWLGQNFFDKSLYKNFSLPMQADAIRCALLKKYGGIWFDTDTIITSENVKNFLNIDSELILIGTHIGFIVAKKNAKILKKWEKGLKKNIKLYDFYSKLKPNNPIKSFLKFIYKNKIEKWNFLGNAILKRPLKTKNKTLFFSINRSQIKALPETNYATENNLTTGSAENYKHFYFLNDYSDYALKDNAGIIYLHNSWTPKEFLNMSETEFLSCNNTISNIFKKLKV